MLTAETRNPFPIATVIADATETLGRYMRPMLQGRDIDLELLVRNQLTWANIREEDFEKFVHVVALNLVRDLSEAGRLKHLRHLGAIAKVAQMFFWMHEDSSHEDSSRVQRAAAWAFNRVQESKSPAGHREYRLGDSLALWVLGAVSYTRDYARLVGDREMGRESKSQLGLMHRWPSHRVDDRISDLHRLTKNNPRLRSIVQELLPSAGNGIESNLGLQALANRTWDGYRCTCSDPETFVEAIFGDNVHGVWKAPKTADGTDAVHALARIGHHRGDVLIVGGEFVVIEPQGFFDSLLVFCLNQLDDKTSSKWHESRIAVEMRKTWNRHGPIYPGQPWVGDPQHLANAENQPRHVGEFDTLVVADRTWFIDVQAKTAGSERARSRERTPTVEAFGQHLKAREFGSSGIWLVRKRDVPDHRDEKLLKPGPLRVGDQDLTHVPITVATESVHQWPIGRSLRADGFARVMTTLDHLRTVNDLVPELFRPVYWAERFAQEHDELMFVDEVDYLEKWLRILRGERLEINTQLDRANADSGPVNSYFYISNMYALQKARRSSHVQAALNAIHSNIRRGTPKEAAPKFTAALMEATHGSEFAIDFLRVVVGTNYADTEASLHKGVGTKFDGGRGAWCVYPAALDARADPTDCEFILRQRRRGWTLTVPAEHRDAVRARRIVPRFKAKT